MAELTFFLITVSRLTCWPLKPWGEGGTSIWAGRRQEGAGSPEGTQHTGRRALTPTGSQEPCPAEKTRAWGAPALVHNRGTAPCQEHTPTEGQRPGKRRLAR